MARFKTGRGIANVQLYFYNGVGQDILKGENNKKEIFRLGINHGRNIRFLYLKGKQ
jgi:hypothetical protein